MELLWTHHYCLGCDKQTDGAVYCSESCRLADGEKTPEFSMISSTPSYSSSPSLEFDQQSPRQPRPQQATRNNFVLPPAYDFSAHRYGTTPRPSSLSSTIQQRSPSFHRPPLVAAVAQRQQPLVPALTPSSSRSSLTSLRSFSSTTTWSGVQPTEKTADPVAEDTRRQLNEYARIWDQARLYRRRSY